MYERDMCSCVVWKSNEKEEERERKRQSDFWTQPSSLVPKDLLAHRLVHSEVPVVILVLCEKEETRDELRSLAKRGKSRSPVEAHRRSSIE